MTETNKITIVATGTLQRVVTVDGIMKSARGFHYAAGELETTHQQHVRNVPQGVTLDQAYLDQIVGRAAGASVLEALALELVLKARLHRAGISFRGLRNGHDHAALFALLPDAEKQEAEQGYQSRRHPAMRATLAEALAFSASVFVEWRYMHEQPSVQASMGEMQRAFTALADRL